MISWRFLVWIAIALLVVANWLLGDRLPNNLQSVATIVLLVVASATFIASILFDKFKKRDLAQEMKRVDEVMRKEDLRD